MPQYGEELPVAIETTEQAVDKAEGFLSRYYQLRTLKRVNHEDGVWTVEFDVGVLQPKMIRIKVGQDSGEVIEYAEV